MQESNLSISCSLLVQQEMGIPTLFPGSRPATLLIMEEMHQGEIADSLFWGLVLPQAPFRLSDIE